jgi:hypothetical protein
VQVAAAHVFDLQTVLPWEFNGTSPTRSIAAPALTCGLPLAAAELVGTALHRVRAMSHLASIPSPPSLP